MIIGEPQILGQVGRAAQLSREAGTSGPTLNTLFRYAQEAGKHVRSRTLISRGATSIAHAAVEIARQHFGKLSDRKVLVLGAGETGRVAALNLISAGVGELIIANRTPQKAQNLAARLNGRAVPLDQLPDVLAEVDMLIACSSSREPLVSLGVILNATAGRDAERRLLVMDIATPRNVVPEADDAPGVQVYDLDGVQRLCERNRHARRMAARGAEAGIVDWVERFGLGQRSRAAVPLPRALCERAARERAADLHALLQCAPTLDDAQCRTVEAMSRTITNRMLHQQLLLVKQFNSNQLEAATASSSVTNDAFNIGRLNAHPDRRRHPPPSGSHSADAQSHQIAVFDEATHFDASHSLAARQTSTPNSLEAESDR
ncbi:MAG: glutamyl-tRNA reductase [Chloroflexia bacterium]